MKKLLYAFLLTVIFLCTGCLPNYVNVTGFYAPYYILSADMPFADTMNTAQFDNVEKIEEDIYGRCYYSYKTYSTAFHYEIEIHVISQKETKTEIDYYPDYCYIARESEGDPFSEEDIARLKERNDWGKPLNVEKMRQIPNDYQDDILTAGEIGTLENFLCDYIDVEEGYDVYVDAMGINDSNQQMFFCHVYGLNDVSKSDQYETMTPCYILVYQKSDTQPIVAIEEIEPTLDCQDFMHNFRLTWFEPEE